MDNIHLTTCSCERKLLKAIDDLRDKGKLYPHLVAIYAQTANELRKIRRSHFSDCTACQREDAASRSDAA